MKAWLIALGSIAVALGGGFMALTFIAAQGLHDADAEERHNALVQELFSGLLGVVGIAIILLASAYL